MGVIHRRAKLDPDEIPAARAMGLPVLETEHPGFALPCPRLEGTVCTIYGNRPRVCARYECQLLQDLKSGRKTLERSSDLVATAKRLLASMRQAMPEAMTIGEAMSLAQAGDADGGDLPLRRRLDLKLRATALELYLDKHFRNSKDRRSLELTPIDDNTKV
jgi:hypothetical protein